MDEQKAQSIPVAKIPVKKKNNTCLILVIIGIIFLIILAIGGYLGYRYFKNKIKNSLNTANANITQNTPSNNQNLSTKSSDSTSKDTASSNDAYVQALDKTPTEETIVQLNAEIKPILKANFEDVKLTGWFNQTNETIQLIYTAKKPFEGSALESAFTAKDFTKKDALITSEGYLITLIKSNFEYVLTGSNNQEINIVISKKSPE